MAARTTSDATSTIRQLIAGETMAEGALDQRLETLESKVAFQDDLLNALNDVIAQQDQRLASLQRQMQLLHKQQEQLAAASPTDSPAQEPPPPHY